MESTVEYEIEQLTKKISLNRIVIYAASKQMELAAKLEEENVRYLHRIKEYENYMSQIAELISWKQGLVSFQTYFPHVWNYIQPHFQGFIKKDSILSEDGFWVSYKWGHSTVTMEKKDEIITLLESPQPLHMVQDQQEIFQQTDRWRQLIEDTDVKQKWLFLQGSFLFGPNICYLPLVLWLLTQIPPVAIEMEVFSIHTPELSIKRQLTPTPPSSEELDWEKDVMSPPLPCLRNLSL